MNYTKFVAASIAAVALSGPAMADTSSLDLAGAVAEVCEVSLISGASSSVTIANGTTNHPIGGIEVSCNLPGFKLTTSTANDFDLVGVAGGVCPGEIIDYALTFSQAFSDSFDSINEQTVGAFDPAFAGGQTVLISLNPDTNAPNLPGGCELEDTITFEVGPL